MEIITGKIPSTKKTVIYGPEGIGKSTFTSKFPSPLFIDTEGSTKYMDVSRTKPAPCSWEMLMDQVRYVKSQSDTIYTVPTRDYDDFLEYLQENTQNEFSRLLKRAEVSEKSNSITHLPEKQEDKSYLAPDAAHERTDIEATDSMKKADDDMMDDDNIWK